MLKIGSERFSRTDSDTPAHGGGMKERKSQKLPIGRRSGRWLGGEIKRKKPHLIYISREQFKLILACHHHEIYNRDYHERGLANHTARPSIPNDSVSFR